MRITTLLGRSTLAVVLAGGLTLAACGGDDDNTSDPTEAGGGDSETTGDGGDTGTTVNDGDGTCDLGDLPPELAAMFQNTGQCDYIQCVFEELGVDSAEDLRDKYGDMSDAESQAAITSAVTSCIGLVQPNP